jgi:methionyl-tRNA formyltransferase
MRALKIVFMGSPDFAVPSLQKLAAGNHTVCAVVTGTDKKRGRGSTLTPTPVKGCAQELGIPVIECDDMADTGLAKKLSELKPDLFAVVAFKILPDSLLQIPAYGAVNLHASLLPKYRGAAPIHHAVMNGETETGCTVFKLDKGMDTGGIIKQLTIPVGRNDTTGSVYTRLMEEGSSLLARSIDLLANGFSEFIKQDDSLATKAPKLFDKDCRVDFNRPAKVVHNHIRGLSPSPAAYAMLGSSKVKLFESDIDIKTDEMTQNGSIFEDSGHIFVMCKDRALCLIRIQYQGRKAMTATEFYRGYQGPLVFT